MSTLASFQNQVKPNWCPGCGDYAVQMALQQAAVKLNLEPHQLALVSGIGCSDYAAWAVICTLTACTLPTAGHCPSPRVLSWPTPN
ncbi:hypothetical protein [Phascolarctobacterium sp.]|uniref:hypothetical protein n=1 Tax=Phascolarctobacterium sp. TaxID=2049039 RepID=UPI0030D861A8